MAYYHNSEERAVYSAPDNPNVKEVRSRGQTVRWSISALIEVTRADNYYNPRTNNWHDDTTFPVRDSYDATRDSREEAIRFFKSAFYHPLGQEIEFGEYSRLRRQYEATALSNTAPRARQ